MISILFLVSENVSIPFLMSLFSISNNSPTAMAHKLFNTKCSPPTGTFMFSSLFFKLIWYSLPFSNNWILFACISLSSLIPYVFIFIWSLFSSYHLCNKSLSLLITIYGFCAPSNISNFAFNIFSLDPKFPICDVPIFVIMHIFGFAILESKWISPKWFIPISNTKASISFGAFSIVNGIPILLLLFPTVLHILYFCATTLATKSFVLVFPTLPVIAITGTS